MFIANFTINLRIFQQEMKSIDQSKFENSDEEFGRRMKVAMHNHSVQLKNGINPRDLLIQAFSSLSIFMLESVTNTKRD
jgi:hypothetical protein